VHTVRPSKTSVVRVKALILVRIGLDETCVLGLRFGCTLQVPGKAGSAAGWAVRIAVADATARAGQRRKRTGLATRNQRACADEDPKKAKRRPKRQDKSRRWGPDLGGVAL
jgi:hypothetical protein